MTTLHKAQRLFADMGNRDAHGNLSFWFVLPTTSLRDLVYRRLRAKYPELNYCCEWRDAKGYGLQLTVAGWVGPNHCYHVPN